MKVRRGFVSNSSSSSFLIPINALNYCQIKMIEEHYTECDPSDVWKIEVNDKCVFGYTFMDNFDMRYFLPEIVKVEDKYIFWQEDEIDVNIDELNREIIQESRKDKLDNINENENEI